MFLHLARGPPALRASLLATSRPKPKPAEETKKQTKDAKETGEAKKQAHGSMGGGAIEGAGASVVPCVLSVMRVEAGQVPQPSTLNLNPKP